MASASPHEWKPCCSARHSPFSFLSTCAGNVTKAASRWRPEEALPSRRFRGAQLDSSLLATVLCCSWEFWSLGCKPFPNVASHQLVLPARVSPLAVEHSFANPASVRLHASSVAAGVARYCGISGLSSRSSGLSCSIGAALVVFLLRDNSDLETFRLVRVLGRCKRRRTSFTGWSTS